MCITCEHMLYEEHRDAEMEGKVKRCRKCKKFPSNGGASATTALAWGRPYSKSGA
jgi:NAD-dependent SIR2 family protein deacetylase